jgi:quaternary ammonium compound-resistance protein SugE
VVWTGIRATGTIILGIPLLGESGGPVRVLFLMLIVAGVIGLRLPSTS